jgi:hypothetical protein
MLEDFYEQLFGRKQNHAAPQLRQYYLGQMDVAYGRYLHEYNNYSQAAIQQSVAYQGQDIMSYARLTQLRSVLYNTLNLVESRPDDAAVYQDAMIAKHEHDLAGAAKTVYKVGNNHVGDIRARAQNLAWVLDEAQYKAIFRL